MNRRTILKMLAAQAVPRGSGIQAGTTVAIVADRFLINGQPTYAGRSWRGMRIEGLLINSRMIQGIFDDLNPETREMWIYPDTAVGEYASWGYFDFRMKGEGFDEGYESDDW